MTKYGSSSCCFLSLNSLFSFQTKWISLFFFIVFVVTLATSLYMNPVKCKMTASFNASKITYEQLNENCFNDDKGIRVYKLCNKALPIFCGLSAILYLLLKPLWDLRKPRLSGFTFKTIILSNLNLIKTDAHLFPVSLLHYSIQNSKISSLFFAYLIFLYAYPLLIYSNLDYIILNHKFGGIGIRFLSNPISVNTEVFPREIDCNFTLPSKKIVSTSCDLTLNDLYELINVLIWFLIILIFSMNTFCLIQNFLLKISKGLRKSRLTSKYDVLIENEVVLNRLADNPEVIFTLESILGRLRRKEFDNLIASFIKDYSYTVKKPTKKVNK